MFYSDEHKRHSKDCPFLKIKNPYTITVGDILTLERKALEYYIVSNYALCSSSQWVQIRLIWMISVPEN